MTTYDDFTIAGVILFSQMVYVVPTKHGNQADNEGEDPASGDCNHSSSSRHKTFVTGRQNETKITWAAFYKTNPQNEQNHQTS